MLQMSNCYSEIFLLPFDLSPYWIIHTFVTHVTKWLPQNVIAPH